jgi:hypothetical protein
MRGLAGSTVERAHANADLISLAPDLAEALRNLLTSVSLEAPLHVLTALKQYAPCVEAVAEARTILSKLD